MNINKCINISCDLDYCFAECNNMYSNVYYLKYLHDKLTSNDDFLSDNLHNIAYLLRKEFQKKFIEICLNFEKEYDEKIINKIEEHLINKQ